MKNIYINISRWWIVMVFTFISLTSFGQAFKHPGLLSIESELIFIKSKIQAGEQPWRKAYDVLKANVSLTYKPSALVNVPDDARTQDVMTLDGSTAYACALIWYMSGDKNYANKAIEILNAWSVFSTHPNYLYLSWAVPQFLNAAEILRYSPGSGWLSADILKFNTMVKGKFLPAMKNNTWVNNAMMSTIEGQIACSIYLDDRTEFTAAIGRWRTWIPGYIYITSDGPTPKLVGRTTIGYWGTGTGEHFINGECMETCRDLNHTKMGTFSLMYGAEMAWHQDVDLWREEKERFISFTELHAGWMIGAVPVPVDICNKEGIWCQGAVSWGTPSGHPPCNPACWEMILNHYVNRLGLGSRLPLTVKMTLANRPNGSINARNGKFNTLTHANITYSTTAVAPEINLLQGTTNFGSGIGKFNFADPTFINTSSSPVIFTIQNIGNANLSVSNIAVKGVEANQFKITQSSLASIAGPAGKGTFTVVFSPNSVGNKTAIISISNNDGNENPYTISVTGNAISRDCAGVIDGTAKTDACGVCVGGTTGKITVDTDKDGHADCVDIDDDNDGILDANDCAPLNPLIKGKTIWYADTDGDGKGDAATSLLACTKPLGYVAVAGDVCLTDADKVLPGNCGCNKTETSCTNIDPSGINGPGCSTPLQVLSFSLDASKRTNATSYSWWFTGASDAVTPSSDGLSASVKLSAYFTSGEVCVGVNLSIPPYYTQYCKPVSTCTTTLRLAEPTLPVAQVLIYPNPSSDLVTVDASQTNMIPLKIQILNGYGKIVFETSSTNLLTVISVANLEQGTYSVKTEFASTTSIQKLVIIK